MAGRKGKRPGVASILVALLLVPLLGSPSRSEWHLVKLPYREMPPVTSSFVG